MARIAVAALLVASLVPSGVCAQELDDAERLRLERSAHELEVRETAEPVDVGASCELGWIRFRLGDARARATLERGIAAAGEPAAAPERRRLGTCLYNRGRVLEDAGDLDGAAADYRRSIALRPNATVAERLASLESARTAALGRVETFDPPRDCDVLPDEIRAPMPVGYCPFRILAHATLTTGALREAWLLDEGALLARVGDERRLLSLPVPRGWTLSSNVSLEVRPGPRGVPALLVVLDRHWELTSVVRRRREWCFLWDGGGGSVPHRCVTERETREDGREWAVRIEVSGPGVITRSRQSGRPPADALGTLQLDGPEE